MRGALESHRNIAILDGIDFMQKESANAMLKTLEEPPSGALMLLLTERVHAVLPTIVSRCQMLRFSYVPPEQIRSHLVSRFQISNDDKRLDDVVNTGSLGQSLFLWDNPVREITAEVVEFWKMCAGQDWMAAAAMIDRLSEHDNTSVYENFFVEMVHLVRNAFFRKIGGTENYIMGDRSLELDIGRISTPDQVEEIVKLCEKSIGHLKAHAGISLILVNFAINIMEILNGKEQQVS